MHETTCTGEVFPADDKYITNPNSAPLNAFISTYLLAMSSNFSFFIPTDNALKRYYDPVSMVYSQPYMLAFNFDSAAGIMTFFNGHGKQKAIRRTVHDHRDPSYFHEVRNPGGI